MGNQRGGGVQPNCLRTDFRQEYMVITGYIGDFHLSDVQLVLMRDSKSGIEVLKAVTL